MKIQFIKNFFKSTLFFVKHIVLFTVLNSVLHYLFNVFLFDVLNKTFTMKMANFFNNDYINPPLIFFVFLLITKTIIKLSFYTIALNNDLEDVKNDITIYIGDFINNIYYIFMSGYAFIFIGLLACAPIITSILYLNCCIFFMIYAVVRRKNDVGERYGPIETISKSFTITKNNRLKLIFVNTIITICVVFCLLYMPKEIIVNKVNIHYVVQLLIFDFVMVYLLRIGFALDKIETEKIEDARRKEMENQYNAMRARSTV